MGTCGGPSSSARSVDRLEDRTIACSNDGGVNSNIGEIDLIAGPLAKVRALLDFQTTGRQARTNIRNLKLYLVGVGPGVSR